MRGKQIENLVEREGMLDHMTSLTHHCFEVHVRTASANMRSRACRPVRIHAGRGFRALGDPPCVVLRQSALFLRSRTFAAELAFSLS